MAKDGQLLLVRKNIMFFVCCKISNIFTGLTHFHQSWPKDRYLSYRLDYQWPVKTCSTQTSYIMIKYFKLQSLIYYPLLQETKEIAWYLETDHKKVLSFQGLLKTTGECSGANELHLCHWLTGVFQWEGYYYIISQSLRMRIRATPWND